MKNIVFAGGTSLLAQCWIRDENPNYNFILGIHNRKPDHKKCKTYVFDYDDTSKLYSQLKSLKTDVLINCIGFTSVEECEKNKEKAFQSNAILAKEISKVCKELSVKMVHISTDHLFNGTSAFADEKTPLDPVNNYAESKGEGENFILDENPDAIIIRTNFFGWGPNYRRSFSDKIIKCLENNETINLFRDVFFTPVSVKTLRDNIYNLIKKNAKGIFNVCSNERITKYQFGLMLSKAFGYSTQLINPVSIEDIPNLTARPKDMSLSNHKVCSYLGNIMPSIEKQIYELKREKDFHKVRHLIPYGRQDVNEKDIDKVVSVLRSDYVTQGPVIEKFERRVASYCEAKFAYACNSATSALHVACLALGVKKGDLVWTSPISFVASSNCALYCGADVDFVDIDPSTYNMSTSSLEKKLIKAKKNDNLPKVVIPVHLAGQSCEMEKIHELSKKYNFKIIEDASHAIGAKYKGKSVGSCSFSDISVFSFHPVKIITTCEGGMCLTNNRELGNLISRYRSHGITRQPSEMTKTPDGSWYYEQLNLGLNYRMNDVQAALGLSQMDRLEEFIDKRRDIANRYNEMLEKSVVQIPNQHPDTLSSYHLYIIRLRRNKKITHKQLFEKFRLAGVLVNIHYIPIYRQPYYKALGFDKDGFEEAEKYYNEAISIPIFPGLTVKEQKRWLI